MVRSQIAAWMTELQVLRQDPRVRKFTELRQKIDEADAFIVEAGTPPPVANRTFPFDPYDAFEFARDYAGRDISTVELSKLAYGRFPEMSKASRGLMMRYLIDNGAAEVARRTASGHPTWYRFKPPGNGGDHVQWTGQGVSDRPDEKREGLGLPTSELSGFKADDLDDVGAEHGKTLAWFREVIQDISEDLSNH